MKKFRVVDLQTKMIDATEIIVEASNPEAAARQALGADLVRSGTRRNLRARVYYAQPGTPLTMVRLYTKVADSHALSGDQALSQ